MAQVQAQVGDWWQGELAKGASSRQGEQAVQSAEFQQWLDERISEALVGQSYLRRTARTRMRADSDRWWDAAVAEESLGGPPAKASWERYPSLQKMAQRMAAHAARQSETQDALAEIERRHREHFDLNRGLIEAQHAKTKTRKLIR